MSLSDINQMRIGITACKIISMSMRVGDVPEQGEEIQMEFKARFRRVDSDGSPVGLDSDISIKANEGKVLSLDMTVRTLFEFDEGVPREDAEMYLAKVGATRAIDASRTYVETVSSMCPLPVVTIPPITVEVDPTEWHKGPIEA